MQEIESTIPFDLGYPHSMLSGARDKQISTKDPAFVVQMCGFFSGVDEPQVRT
jgi:hypothetical protein